MTENLYTTHKIRTYTGLYVDVFDLQPEDICIEDIAHALSICNRWGGHTLHPVNVGMHSIKVAGLLPKDLQLCGLLHDASDCYLADIGSPTKRRLPDVLELELNIMTRIAAKFGFAWPEPQEVKMADTAVLEHEWNCYMLGRQQPPSPPHIIEKEFLMFFNLITNGNSTI